MTRVYSSLKPLRFLDRFKPGPVKAPVQVRIKPVNACNHNCWYCAYRVDNLQLGSGMDARDRLTAAKFDEIASDLASMGVKAVTFSGGGEPLIHARLPNAVRRLAAGGMRIGILTNGSLLRGEAAETLAAHATWVRVSMDGWDGPSYAASRGCGEDEFAEVMANLERFSAAAPACLLGASFIISRRNAEHILEFCRRAKDAGVRSVKLSACVTGNSTQENDDYHATIEKRVAEQIDECLKLAGPGFEVVNHYHRMSGRFDKTYRACRIGQLLTVIGADQNVYICQDKAYTVAGRLGSIAERSFKDFWFSEENSRALHAIDPSRDCRHHCVAHLKNLLLDEILDLDPAHSDFV